MLGAVAAMRRFPPKLLGRRRPVRTFDEAHLSELPRRVILYTDAATTVAALQPPLHAVATPLADAA